eukprot:768660-Hanusia_phi.AAC.6
MDSVKRKRSSATSNNSRYTKKNKGKLQEIVRRIIHIQRERRKWFDEQMETILNQHQRHKYKTHLNEVQLVDKIPTSDGYNNVTFNLKINQTFRPPKILQFYFPDLYNMMLKNPHRKTYINFARMALIDAHVKVVNSLSEVEQETLKSWTGTDVYWIISALLRLLFNKPCYPKMHYLGSQENFYIQMNRIINEIIKNKLFQKYFTSTFVTTEELKRKNYYKLKTIVLSYLDDLYAIVEKVKYRVLKELGDDFFDHADVYVFRGQDDPHYTQCEDTALNCMFSTSLRFNVAAKFLHTISERAYKTQANTNNDKIKNNLYIYKLNKNSNIVYVQTISHFPSEFEMLMLPEKKDDLFKQLSRYLDVDLMTLFDEMKLPSENDDLADELEDMLSEENGLSQELLDVLSSEEAVTGGGKDTLTIQDITSFNMSDNNIQLHIGKEDYIIKVCQMY